MNNKQTSNRKNSSKRPYNVAVVGGGSTCKFLLELFQLESFSFLNINLTGVCDTDPDAEGLRLAQDIGIYTTNNFRDLFKLKDLDYIIEMTNSKRVLLNLIQKGPEQIGILDHRVGRLFLNISNFIKRLKSAEYHLILEKMFSDFLIQQSSEAIVVLNTDFTIAETNEAYLKNAGRSRDEVIGAYCYEISHGLNAPCAIANPALKCPMIETLKTGKSAHVIHEFDEAKNLKSYGNIVTYPLKDQEGNILKIIEIWRDITEEISSRWELRAAELKADLNKVVQEDRLISLGKLAASCAHEINNPIQGLLTFTVLMQNMLEQETPGQEELAEFRSHLSLMATELERIGNIASGLLSFSKSSPGGYTGIDLNEFLREIIVLIKNKTKLQNIELSVKLLSVPFQIQGNINQLQQCFLNLFFNAIEAMPGGGRLDIISEIDNEEQKVRVEIRDTGPGIAEEDLEHIFDPFFSTKEEGEGTGLGLSIVYGIVKNHKGDIQVNNRAGKGCSFILEFPVS